MLELVGIIPQATLVALVLYNSIMSLWGWPERHPANSRNDDPRLRVVVPAHDEARVLPGVLSDLKASDFPAHRVDIWVIDDRSTDNTATIATSMDVAVATRASGDGGKGMALAWYLENHPLSADETLVVFDADNRVPPNTLSRIADEIAAGFEVVQCYLDVTNPDGSWMTEASALSYWAGNRMVQLARSNLGWSADLGGTAMGISAKALEQAGGFADSLTEDQDLGVRLLLAGHRVEWLHDVRVQDEKPESLGVAVRQRARWMAGKRATRRRHLGALMRKASPASLDMAIRLLQPGRSFMALLTVMMALVAIFTNWAWVFPWQLWGILALVQVVLPIPFLFRDGVEPRHIARYPLLAILAALWLPIRLVSSTVSGWYHTPHAGTTSDDAPNADL